LERFGNLTDKENKNFKIFDSSNPNNELNNDLKSKTTSNDIQQNSLRGINTNKKNFSSLTLAHNDNPKNNYNKNLNHNYTEFKTRINNSNNINTKDDFCSSSSYGAYYKLRK